MIDTDAEKLRKELESKGFAVTDGPVPEPTMKSIAVCRERCESNVCGAYGETWACPPGSATPEECIEKLSGYGSAMLISRVYHLNPKDRESVEPAIKGFQDECRNAAVSLRKGGADVFVMADGRCGYCDDCTYPDDGCRFPEMLVPSISGFGIEMGDYVRSCGRDFAFADDRVELFGIILFR